MKTYVQYQGKTWVVKRVLKAREDHRCAEGHLILRGEDYGRLTFWDGPPGRKYPTTRKVCPPCLSNLPEVTHV